MIEGLKPYPAMKDSGVPWLGELPEHWQLQRTKTLLRERVEKEYPDEPLLAATQSKGVVRKEQYENRTVLALKDLHLLKLVRVGDFVISLRSFQGGIEFAREQGIISPAYTILYPARVEVHGYLARLFKSAPYIENLSLHVTGIRQGQNIDYERLGRADLPVPPLREQAAIVRFLDHADRRIRRYIRAKQKLIKLLEEQKQAIIHRAVTRGLDPNIRLKPSGVEWLGDVPERWEVRRIASFSPKITNGWVGPTRDILKDEGIPYVQSLHIKRGKIRFAKKYFVGAGWLEAHSKVRLRQGDVVVVQTGDIGQVACVTGEFDGAGCHALIIIRTDPGVVGGEFLDLVLRSRYGYDCLKSVQTGALHPHLNCTWVREIFVPVPPLREQTDILRAVSAATQSLERIIEDAEREVLLLREYRTRLIADVVTGKLDVREAAARLPEQAEELEPLDETEALGEVEGESAADDLDPEPEEAEA